MIRVAVFSARPYDREHLQRAARGRGVAMEFFDARLLERREAEKPGVVSEAFCHGGL